jgi:ankyrin repeat protein
MQPAVRGYAAKSASENDVVDYLASLDPSKAEELLRAALKQRNVQSEVQIESKADIANVTKQEEEEEEDVECVECGGAIGDLLHRESCGRDCQHQSDDATSKWSFQEEVVSQPEVAEQASLDLMRGIELGSVDLAAASYGRAQLDFVGEAGWTCLHWAVHAACTSQSAGDDCGQVGMADCCAPAPASPEMRQFVKALLQSRKVASCIDARAEGGATALMFAADAGDDEVCDWLLAVGADTSLVDDDGDPAAFWARQKGHHDLAEKLARR